MNELIIKTDKQIEKIRHASKIVGYCHFKLQSYLKVGISTIEINDFVENIIIKHGAKSAFKGYQGYPDIVCIAINDCVIHGIGSGQVLKEGDIISIDIGVDYQGYFGDSAWTYPIGKITQSSQLLLDKTQLALEKSLIVLKDKTPVKKVSKEIQKVAYSNKLGIVRQFVGHGVGCELHEEPMIPNFVDKNQKDILLENMIVAIEPIFTENEEDVYIAEDGWSAFTYNGDRAAHFEHTVLITKNGHQVLTVQKDWFKKN